MSTRRSRKRRSLTATLLVSAILVAGCSSAAVTTGTPIQAVGLAGDRADADVRFSQEMIPHHRQTIQLADLVDGRSENPYVRDLAAKIKKVESADIDLMSGWLRSWKVEVPAEGDHAAHNMPGMLSATQISSLEGRSGAAFDKLWLSVLGKHLNSGVQMAQVAIALGRHRPTTQLAEKMVTEQRAQITEIGKKLA
ncbi:DUF305 domain-containing protein [Streptosporangium sp. NBC_01495]|uniref:DUF305 domain-containing protein n=1 Tax=Streptosporangium sp. NBC_01495 TaxID=2903899 RepID=UPI002E33576A|nr:DUF305 domain-containing protein [Streptosporangium sp. NBC_01495]